MCTSADRPEYEHRARRAGANNCFAKPLDLALLRGEIARLLQWHARRSVAARDRASCAVREEIDKRFSDRHGGVVPEQYQKALTRVARGKARDAYVTAGGTLSAFERIWETLWDESLNTHSA
jgi:hypothetical protein